MDDWESERCPVCHEKVGKPGDSFLTTEQQEELKDKIWKPGDPIPEAETQPSELRARLKDMLAERRTRK